MISVEGCQNSRVDSGTVPVAQGSESAAARRWSTRVGLWVRVMLPRRAIATSFCSADVTAREATSPGSACREAALATGGVAFPSSGLGWAKPRHRGEAKIGKGSGSANSLSLFLVWGKNRARSTRTA